MVVNAEKDRVKKAVDPFVGCLKLSFTENKFASEGLRGDKPCGYIHSEMLDPFLDFFFFQVGVKGHEPSPVAEAGHVFMKGKDGKARTFNGSSDT